MKVSWAKPYRQYTKNTSKSREIFNKKFSETRMKDALNNNDIQKLITDIKNFLNPEFGIFEPFLDNFLFLMETINKKELVYFREFCAKTEYLEIFVEALEKFLKSKDINKEILNLLNNLKDDSYLVYLLELIHAKMHQRIPKILYETIQNFFKGNNIIDNIMILRSNNFVNLLKLSNEGKNCLDIVQKSVADFSGKYLYELFKYSLDVLLLLDEISDQDQRGVIVTRFTAYILQNLVKDDNNSKQLLNPIIKTLIYLIDSNSFKFIYGNNQLIEKLKELLCGALNGFFFDENNYRLLFNLLQILNFNDYLKETVNFENCNLDNLKCDKIIFSGKELQLVGDFAYMYLSYEKGFLDDLNKVEELYKIDRKSNIFNTFLFSVYIKQLQLIYGDNDYNYMYKGPDVTVNILLFNNIDFINDLTIKGFVKSTILPKMDKSSNIYKIFIKYYLLKNQNILLLIKQKNRNVWV